MAILYVLVVLSFVAWGLLFALAVVKREYPGMVPPGWDLVQTPPNIPFSLFSIWERCWKLIPHLDLG